MECHIVKSSEKHWNVNVHNILRVPGIENFFSQSKAWTIISKSLFVASFSCVLVNKGTKENFKKTMGVRLV